MTVAGWLNEHALALQAVILAYGLLSPIIFYRVINLPTIQVSSIELLGFINTVSSGDYPNETCTVHYMQIYNPVV